MGDVRDIAGTDKPISGTDKPISGTDMPISGTDKPISGADHLILVGMPASGKSTVGRALAQRLGWPCVDLDALLAAQSGGTVGELLRGEGELAFRRRESALLQQVLAGPRAVIATGGGTAAYCDAMAQLCARGTVIWLDAPVATLSQRAVQDATDRPLLGATLQAVQSSLMELRAARLPTYARAHLRVDANAAPAQVAVAVQAAVARPWSQDLSAEAGKRVVVHSGEPSAAADAIAALAAGNRCALVVDRAVLEWAEPLVAMLQARNLAPVVLPVVGGEKCKTARVLAQVWTSLADNGIGRGDLIIGMGGGAVTDLAGLAAATWLRGVRWIALPTTLLAMADASVGGKTAIDLPQGKNLVGAFHPPQLVWCGLAALQTLPPRHFRAGLAEIAKMFLAFDAQAWQQLVADSEPLRRRQMATVARHLHKAIGWKAQVVAADPRENADLDQPMARAKLNLGHTFGHAVEAASQFAVPHGEAVGLGLCAEAQWARHYGDLTAEACKQVMVGLGALGLNTHWQAYATPSTLSNSNFDKKLRGGQLRLPVLRAVGDARLADVALDVWQAQVVKLGNAPSADTLTPRRNGC